MKIAIYGSRRQDPYIKELSVFFSTLADAGAEVVMHRKLYSSLLHLMPLALKTVTRVADGHDFDADVAVCLGGDGTFLRTAMWVGSKNIPIIGVNTGHLGYLSAATIGELPEVATELISGHFTTETRSLIEVVSPAINTWPYALNEVAVMKDESSSMISADTTINGTPLAVYRADGLIICTPTGSTAYNLSVGGPVLQPGAPVWAISPVAAHSLRMRPLVVSDDSCVSVRVAARAAGFRLSLDGRSAILPVGTEVMLRRASFCLRLITRPGHEFPAPLRAKLGWGE